MPSSPLVDLKLAHEFFAAECFNDAWRLIEKTTRTDDENEEMIAVAHTSMWHWLQREDCRARNRSIGYWQLSRVYALVGQHENARRYGDLCLKHSLGDEPFYVAYAYECLARAAQVAGDVATVQKLKAQALALVPAIADEDDRSLIAKDLATLVT